MRVQSEEDAASAFRVSFDKLTLGSESEPGQVGFVRQREGFAVDELPFPSTELQQLDTQSLFAVKTCS